MSAITDDMVDAVIVAADGRCFSDDVESKKSRQLARDCIEAARAALTPPATETKISEWPEWVDFGEGLQRQRYIRADLAATETKE